MYTLYIYIDVHMSAMPPTGQEAEVQKSARQPEAETSSSLGQPTPPQNLSETFG